MDDCLTPFPQNDITRSGRARMIANPVQSPTDPTLDYRADEPVAKLRANIILVTGGRATLLGAWFAATMLMARILGPASFGLYTLCQNAIRVFTGCFGDPLDMAVMREAPLYLKNDRPRALRVIRSAFWLRTGLGVASIAIAGAVPWLISGVIFGSADHRGLAVLCAVGILGDLLLRSALGYFQASERFVPFMLTDVVWQLGRAAAVVSLWALGWLSAPSAILLYVLAPYVAFLFAVVLLPRDVLEFVPPDRQQIREIFHYSKWLVAAMMMAAIYERLDLFMLEWFRGIREVGIYGGALALAVIPDFLNGCVQTVLAPKVAPAQASGTFNQLQRNYLVYAVPLGLLAIAGAMLLGGPLIRTFLSAKYLESIPAFRILVISTIFNIVFTPLPEALLNFVAPRKVTAVTFTGLVLVSVGGVLIIPRFGVTGAAILILCARVTIGIIIVVLASHIAAHPSAGSPGTNVLPIELPGHLEEER
jgi:O-antigen/teichoic acid export membrane protein